MVKIFGTKTEAEIFDKKYRTGTGSHTKTANRQILFYEFMGKIKGRKSTQCINV
jgi:hypothetical protein